jgi:hypothetical protein
VGAIWSRRDFRSYLALDKTGRSGEVGEIAFRAALMVGQLVRSAMLRQRTLAQLGAEAAEQRAGLLSFSATAGGGTVVVRTRDAPAPAGGASRGSADGSLDHLSLHGLVAELADYAAVLTRRSAGDPRAGLVLATQAFLYEGG